MTNNLITILGINFYNGTAQQVVDQLKSGGLLAVPSGPGLINIKKDPYYYRSLLKADLVIPDSGYMVLIWNLIKREKIKKISGWNFLVTFLADAEVKRSSKILLVDPRTAEADDNLQYLKVKGFNLDNISSYVAPWYEKNSLIIDGTLLSLVEEKKPQFIIINIAGGIQEKLGAYLIESLSYKPAIICTGAAIAFLTGHQAHMPRWADNFFLGWLIRCIDNPKVYIPRYIKAFKLLVLMLKYGENPPA